MNWNITRDIMPEDKTLCDTMSEGGQQTELWYESGLWFYPDKSMYVYYVPRYWRYV